LHYHIAFDYLCSLNFIPDGSSSSSTSHKVKRNASSTSETARLTDSMGRPSSDYLYDHDEITEAPSGYCDADITHVDENEFNGPDMVELSTLEESFIITDRPDYRRWVACTVALLVAGFDV